VLSALRLALVSLYVADLQYRGDKGLQSDEANSVRHVVYRSTEASLFVDSYKTTTRGARSRLYVQSSADIVSSATILLKHYVQCRYRISDELNCSSIQAQRAWRTSVNH